MPLLTMLRKQPLRPKTRPVGRASFIVVYKSHFPTGNVISISIHYVVVVVVTNNQFGSVPWTCYRLCHHRPVDCFCCLRCNCRDCCFFLCLTIT